MLGSEPSTSALRNIGTYAWWFFVTVTTTRYGDFAPVSGAARAAAAFIMVVGFGSFGFVIAKMTELSINLTRRRMRGEGSVDLTKHVAILGNRGPETHELIRQLAADRDNTGRDIVLVSYTTLENPFPGTIEFVRGELSSDDVMERANIREASQVIIHAKEDAETLVVSLAVKHYNANAHIIVNLNDATQEVNLLRIDPGIVCIKPPNVPLMVRELHNRGIASVAKS
jgi:voltage-gated potassium channel